MTSIYLFKIKNKCITNQCSIYLIYVQQCHVNLNVNLSLPVGKPLLGILNKYSLRKRLT